MGAITKAHGALQAGGYEGRYAWSTAVNGGEGTVMTLAFPMNSWAEMAEPDPSIDQIFAEQLGQEGAAELMEAFFGAVLNTESWMARILPDITYIPGS